MRFLSDSVVQHLRDVAAWPTFDDERYTDVAALGVGGMGRVYSALDAPLGRRVAIKVSHAPVEGTRLDDRLRHEAEVLARLEHPGIVPVHDLGTLSDGRLFYVMKLVRGRTLEQTEPRPVSESAVLAIFERVVDAVAFAHAQGVVHRDLKPSNIMLGAFGEVLVMDWGLARLVEGAPEADDVRMGTRGFMSPEQAAGSSASVGPPSDVYGLGAVLFWLFHGKVPPRDSRALHAALRKRVAGGRSLNRRLRAIVQMCLAPRPEDRYPDAAQLGADVKRYRAGEAVQALPEGLLDRVVRFGSRHLTIILLVLAYLLMRAAVAWWQLGP